MNDAPPNNAPSPSDPADISRFLTPDEEAQLELEEQRKLAQLRKSAIESAEELKMLQSARNLTPSQITSLLHWLVKREILLSERVETLENQVEALQARLPGSGVSRNALD